MTRYMLLIYSSASRWKALTQADKEDFLAEYVTFTKKIMASGEHLHGGPLAAPAQSRTVRVRRGRREIGEGSLADADQYLAGYYMVECADLNRALEIAAEIPDSKLNVVEVRPLAPMGGLEA